MCAWSRFFCLQETMSAFRLDEIRHCVSTPRNFEWYIFFCFLFLYEKGTRQLSKSKKSSILPNIVTQRLKHVLKPALYSTNQISAAVDVQVVLSQLNSITPKFVWKNVALQGSFMEKHWPRRSPVEEISIFHVVRLHVSCRGRFILIFNVCWQRFQDGRHIYFNVHFSLMSRRSLIAQCPWLWPAVDVSRCQD